MSINRVKITVLGRDYVIKSNAEPGYIERIANHVNEKIEEIARKFSGLNREQIIVLAAMNMADDYFQLEEMIELDRDTRGVSDV